VTTRIATSAPAGPPVRKQLTRSGRQRREAAALVIPSLVPIITFSVIPLLQGIWYAFTDASLRRNAETNFVGVANFERLVGDSLFWNSFRIGIIWAVSVTALQLVASLGLALLLNSDLRLRSLTRLLALIPWAMPPVVVAMWTMIYTPNGGPLNAALGIVGLPSDVNWLGNSTPHCPRSSSSGCGSACRRRRSPSSPDCNRSPSS